MLPEDVVQFINDPLPRKQPLLYGQKGHIGHTVAAAGVIESVFSLLSFRDQVIPHIRGLKDPEDPELNYAFKNTNTEVNYILKNGFVFGGNNCSLLFKRYVRQ